MPKYSVGVKTAAGSSTTLFLFCVDGIDMVCKENLHPGLKKTKSTPILSHVFNSLARARRHPCTDTEKLSKKATAGVAFRVDIFPE